MVMGWMVSVRESSDAVLEALRDAILIDADAGSPQGGLPTVLMYDNGKTFVAEVIQQAAALLGFRTRPVSPYSPHKNGKVERCHQTISALALAEMPAWKNGPRDQRGRLYSDQAVDEQTLIRQIAAAVRHYNFQRPHSAIGGQTPWECFSEGTKPRCESSTEAACGLPFDTAACRPFRPPASTSTAATTRPPSSTAALEMG
jgi:putative transposase